MTLPAGFALPADAGAAHPLYVVDKAGFAAWRDAQPAAVQAWLAAQRFDGSAGTAHAWADADGGIAGAVLGKIVVLCLLILFIQRRPRGLFPLKGRAVEA